MSLYIYIYIYKLECNRKGNYPLVPIRTGREKKKKKGLEARVRWGAKNRKPTPLSSPKNINFMQIIGVL